MKAFMKTKKQCNGFTLVELMVSMLAMAVLVLVVGSMLFYGWLGWRRNTESVGMQRDALIAMETISREIRNSTISEVSGDTDGIYFGVSSPAVVRTTAINYLASDIPFSAGVNIRDFNATKISNAVNVNFTLFTSDGADENTYRMSINTRN